MVRFLADASLHDAIVSVCLRREPAMDFLSANEARLQGVSDPEALVLLWEASDAEEWKNRIVEIPPL